jgi:four helix bundle protein
MMNDELKKWQTMSDRKKSDPRDLSDRAKAFALQIIRLYSSLPKRAEAQVVGKQALRSGTSVGAQYREAKRARSTAEFISKLGGSVQELEETIYWLELLVEGELVSGSHIAGVHREAEELMAILVSSVKTVKQRT